MVVFIGKCRHFFGASRNTKMAKGDNWNHTSWAGDKNSNTKIEDYQETSILIYNAYGCHFYENSSKKRVSNLTLPN